MHDKPRHVLSKPVLPMVESTVPSSLQVYKNKELGMLLLANRKQIIHMEVRTSCTL